ncbi:uncharacterized protein LOC109868932 isoform X2 [Oncorhynchus kisutch]|nr:uncharacterized protein LOC109868932 isoform X2 [Oncorhynchus kisutch]
MRCLNLSPGSVRGDIGVVCLLRRLTQPSNTLVLRTAYCAWRSHIQGMQLGRASLIHYHLTLLCKHWLVWRQAGVRLQAWALQAQRAALHWDHRQQSRAYALWRAAWVTARLATEQHRASCLAAAWSVWAARATQREEERSARANQSAGFHRRSLLQHSLLLWLERAEQRRRQRDRLQRIVRRVAQRWREHTHGARLQRVWVEAEQVLSRQILAGKWCVCASEPSS